MTTTIDYKQSTADPIAVDTGNYAVQKRAVSKTVQFGLFTSNENAVWAGSQQLRKESYPFAFIDFSVNRNLFRLQVGDCFKFSYDNYGISEMICRVLQIKEDNLESETITISAMEDIFSVNNAITEYATPTDYAIEAPDYSSVVFDYQDMIEASYVVSGDVTSVIPLVARSVNNQLGFHVYMSSDGGSSYSLLESVESFSCYGTLVQEYTDDTHQIDDDVGIVVDFNNDDIDLFETTTRQEMLGVTNLIYLGTEIMTVQNIDPIAGGDGSRYYLTGVYRGRFDTKKENHAIDDGLYLANGNNVHAITGSTILSGTDKKFKFVPYNAKYSADIADCSGINLTLIGSSRNPYDPINFKANGLAMSPVYTADIDLTWISRVRGDGAGYYIPTITDSYPTWEGYFKVEVWVGGALKRTKAVIDALFWTYTEAMNLSDNTTLASQITFKLTNFIEYEEWPLAESTTLELVVNKS